MNVYLPKIKKAVKKKFLCYGIINYGLFVRIIYGHRGGEEG